MSAATGPDICDLIQLTLILVDMMTAIASAALWAVGTALGVAGLAFLGGAAMFALWRSRRKR